MKRIYIISIFILLIINGMFANTVFITNDIVTDTNWTNNNNYIIEENIEIAPNATLSIHPGTSIKFHTNKKITVFGHINAIGTEDENIIFTSLVNSDDHRWNGIEIKSSNNTFKYSQFTNVLGSAINAHGTSIDNLITNLNIEFSSFINNKYISSAQIDDNGGAAIALKYISNVSIYRNQFNENIYIEFERHDVAGGAAIFALDSDNVNIDYNTFSDNVSKSNAASIFIYTEDLDGITNNVTNNSFHNEKGVIGGAISILNNNSINNDDITTINIDNNTFTSCIAYFLDGIVDRDGCGGAICVYQKSNKNDKIKILNNTFENNFAPSAGGAVAYFNNGLHCELTFIGNEVNNNRVENSISNNICCGGGLYAVNFRDDDGFINIKNSNFSNNYVGTYDQNNNLYRGSGGAIFVQKNAFIENCKITNNYSANIGGGISIINCERWQDNHDPIKDCLIADNTAKNAGGGIYSSHSTSGFGSDYMFIKNTTIANNLLDYEPGTEQDTGGSGLYIENTPYDNTLHVSKFALSKVIISNNRALNSKSEYQIEKKYSPTLNILKFKLEGNCCIDKGSYPSNVSFADINNLGIVVYNGKSVPIHDELLFFDVYTGDNYPIYQYSKCVDPETDTILIGYPYHTILKEDRIKISGKKYSWISFPRSPCGFENIWVQQLLSGHSYSTYESFGIRELSQSGELLMPNDLKIIGEDGTLYYNNNNWSSNTIYNTKSYNFLKIKEDDNGLPARFATQGIKLPDDFTIPGNITNTYWIGYWIFDSQTLKDAFTDENGNYYPEWDKIKSVKSEDVYFAKLSQNTQDNEKLDSNIFTSNPEKLILEYGKGYVFTLYNGESISNFSWHTPTEIVIRKEKKESQLFDIAYKPDYEAIEISELENADNIMEIAVFEGDTCVGAAPVEELPMQLLAYTSDDQRSEIPLTFQVVYNDKTERSIIKSYEVLNKKTLEYEKKPIIAGKQEFSIVKLGKADVEGYTISQLTRLDDNYPNPFNPETTISFFVPQDENISLDIYNVKGQKVKSLYCGEVKQGKHSIVWRGKDDNNQAVASGVYFYKLKAGNITKQKKMLLLK